MTSRRGFILGLGAALAAPAVVRAESLMKIAVLRKSLNEETLLEVLESMTKYHLGRSTFAHERALVLGWSMHMIQSNREVPLLITPIAPEDVYA